MFTTITLTANQRVEFVEPFDFIRVMDTTAAVSLEFYRQGREVDEANGVTAGYSESFAQACDRLAITNGTTAQTITVATRLGSKVEYDRPPTGNVSVTNTPTVLAAPLGTSNVKQAGVTVGVGQVAIATANTNRKGLLIQNNSDTGTIWVNFAAQPPNTTSGLKIRPGETFASDSRVSMLQLNAISDTAGCAVTVVEFE